MRDVAKLLLLVSGLGIGAPVLGAEAPPEWAYPVNPPNLMQPLDDGMARRVPESDAAFTLTQIRDLFFAPDWHPGDHPSMPSIVANGRKPEVRACGSCHRADGSGGPENAGIAGLPAAYIIQQMADFKSGARRTSVPQRLPPQLMIATARAIDDAETTDVAAYFSALPPRHAVKIVETETAPAIQVTGWHLAVAPPTGTGTPAVEPLGRRIVEVPEHLEHFALRDGRARFVAYVPPGSLARGQALAASGEGRTVPCGICHGSDLKGLGAIPGIPGGRQAISSANSTTSSPVPAPASGARSCVRSWRG